MTDAEIIKALECCVIVDGCKKCPRGENGKICRDYNTFIKAISALINRQKAEIERLEELGKTQSIMIGELNKAYENAKSEAIREFAEKLKE